MSIKKVHLLLIDPQNDFCRPAKVLGTAQDGSDVIQEEGALLVPNAWDDMVRVAAMIDRLGKKLDDIHVTLDQHHLMDVAHPPMWKGLDGKPPAPFTIISYQDVESGVWTPVIPSLYRRMLEYTKALQDGGRYPLCIWPPHCLIGTEGSAVVKPVMDALNRWSSSEKGTIDYVSKGSNIYTEHYGAIMAEVPDPADPSTQLNAALVSTIEESDMILLAGEAGSHCLANTTIDLADNFSDPEICKKLVLLTDGTSPVPGFENLQEDFINKMTARGMTLSTTAEILS